jgi:hypothetical protein
VLSIDRKYNPRVVRIPTGRSFDQKVGELPDGSEAGRLQIVASHRVPAKSGFLHKLQVLDLYHNHGKDTSSSGQINNLGNPGVP